MEAYGMADVARLTYQTGFGNELQSEAEAGALPHGRNSPQQPALGLVSELISGTTFTAPRALNRRTYVFRAMPSVVHGRYQPAEVKAFATPPFTQPPNPNQMRWDPFEIPAGDQDFVDGMLTICGNGSPDAQSGTALHVYRATAPMTDRFFLNADGELLIMPDTGTLLIATELGRLQVEPGELALIPRGIKFRVDLPEGPSRGFVCENYGLPFRLPELGLIGSNGLANAADFQVPDAWYEIEEKPCTLVQKFGGSFWEAALDHSPLDVVAWRGSHVPAKFNMYDFVALGTATVDHPDPSIFCALSSPSDPVLGGNADFMVLPPRWAVADDTFRPPGFHRNCVAEYLGVITGKHEGKSASGLRPGGASLHNNWAAHGPDVETFELARSVELPPRKIEDSLVFMIESRRPLQVADAALAAPEFQRDYQDHWQGFIRRFPAPQ
jgi:homogentisate 1,2-dioxygenase